MYICKNAAGEEQFTNTPVSANCREFELSSPITTVSINHKISVTNFSLVSPAGKDTYDHYITKAAERYGMDPNLIKAVIHVESYFNRYAVSSKGARGLMQLMPQTMREVGCRDPFDPVQNINGGTRYLKIMMDMFHNDLSLALAAYNAGPNRVKKTNRVPFIPETMQYVRKVKTQYKYYQAHALPVKPATNIKVGELEIASIK